MQKRINFEILQTIKNYINLNEASTFCNVFPSSGMSNKAVELKCPYCVFLFWLQTDENHSEV
jgi:hypothetical protein